MPRPYVYWCHETDRFSYDGGGSGWYSVFYPENTLSFGFNQRLGMGETLRDHVASVFRPEFIEEKLAVVIQMLADAPDPMPPSHTQGLDFCWEGNVPEITGPFKL